MTTRNLFAVAALSTLLMSACSVHSSSDAPSVLPKEAFDNKVVGPNIEGAWTSNCFQDFGSKHRQFKAVFQGQNIVRSDSEFADKECTHLLKKSELKGVFRYSDKTSYGGYVVDYHFDLGQGITEITAEEILLENNSLYISGFMVGFGSIDKTRPMTKDGASQPTPPAASPAPNEDPNSIAGVRTSSWQSARYAFCNAQGYAYILDFKNQDLSKVQAGNVEILGRPCNSNRAFKVVGASHFQLDRSAKFKMTLDDGYLSDNGRGMQDTWAVIAGNSGICTFLENKGVKDVFGADYGIWECK